MEVTRGGVISATVTVTGCRYVKVWIGGTGKLASSRSRRVVREGSKSGK